MKVDSFSFPRCCFLLVVCLFAADASGEQTEHRHRVLGLFQADREDDLAKVVGRLPGVIMIEADFEKGEATFRYDADVLFPGRKTSEQLAQGLDQLLRRESRGTFEVTPLTDNARSKLKRVEIGIVGLDCKGCSYGAYRAIYKIEGVENATASFHNGNVVAWIDPDKTSRSVLVEALEQKRVKVKDQPADSP